MRSELSNIFTCVEIQKEILFKHGSEYRSKYEYQTSKAYKICGYCVFTQIIIKICYLYADIASIEIASETLPPKITGTYVRQR